MFNFNNDPKPNFVRKTGWGAALAGALSLFGATGATGQERLTPPQRDPRSFDGYPTSEEGGSCPVLFRDSMEQLRIGGYVSLADRDELDECMDEKQASVFYRATEPDKRIDPAADRATADPNPHYRPQ